MHTHYNVTWELTPAELGDYNWISIVGRGRGGSSHDDDDFMSDGYSNYLSVNLNEADEF